LPWGTRRTSRQATIVQQHARRSRQHASGTRAAHRDGFDTYLQATSVPEGQQVTPLSPREPRELAEIRQKFQPYITFKEE
jgi:hypothetical protein